MKGTSGGAKRPLGGTTTTTQTRGAAAFWPLLWRGAGAGSKLSLRLADVALFDETGLPILWLFTSKTGQVKRKSRDSLTTKALFRAFRSPAGAGPEATAAVAYLEDGSRENVSNAALEGLLLRGPLVGRWKKGINSDLRVEALRVYIRPKGGHGSGFRNCFKFAGKAAPPVTFWRLAYTEGRGQACPGFSP